MESRQFTDMTGNTIHLVYPPKRIISLVPSQTEYLAYLGLEEEVVGITKFCIYPSRWYRSKKRVGGTKKLNLEVIKSLKPDLIIANKEENVREQIEALSPDFPVWTSDITTLFDAYKMMLNIGTITGKLPQAQALVNDITDCFSYIRQGKEVRVAYCIWKDPYMWAGGDTFINSIIESLGWINVFGDNLRYPEYDHVALMEKKVDLVLLASEPYPFKEKHVYEIAPYLPPTVRILQVNGEYFSWYGSRMRFAVAYFNDLIEKYAS